MIVGIPKVKVETGAGLGSRFSDEAFVEIVCTTKEAVCFPNLNKGYEKVVLENGAIAVGINTANEEMTYEAVANAHSIPYTPLEEVLQTVSI